ncbi:hypothetical protein V1517DRAFT_335231 [Lipomyces orientalis]|uniref:Uncharacterized protein n=1 Tax=Lipomyces orientalis TaxID=1233043 RepID=A0ACC3TYA4_9ASCO
MAGKGIPAHSNKLSRHALRQNLTFRLNQLHSKFKIDRRLTVGNQFEYIPGADDEQLVSESAGFIAYNVWRKHADSLKAIFNLPRAQALMAPGVRVTGVFRSPAFNLLDMNRMSMEQTYDFLRRTSHKVSRRQFILNSDIYKLYTNLNHIHEMDDDAIRQYNLVRAKWFGQLMEEHARQDTSRCKNILSSVDIGTAHREHKDDD